MLTNPKPTGRRTSSGHLVRPNRRQLLIGASAFGAATISQGLFDGCAFSLSNQPSGQSANQPEPPPEITTIRINVSLAPCLTPLDVAEKLLLAEGFTDVQRVPVASLDEFYDSMGSGRFDISHEAGVTWITLLEKGYPMVLLSGLHGGCLELLARPEIRSFRELKGKTVSIPSLKEGRYYTLASMATYLGMDPHADINWVEEDPLTPGSVQLFEAGKVDAFLGFPPEPQQLRAKGIGHVIVNTTTDKPWSQYFCCMLAANRDFHRRYPVATKRAIRAILKAADLCAADPEAAAQLATERAGAWDYNLTLQTLKDVPYNRWRDYDPADTLRFYGLRLKEAGIINGNPDRIIAEGTDWRIFNELKRELKG